MAAQRRIKSGGADDGHQHDVRIRESGEFVQPFGCHVDAHALRQQGSQFGLLRRVIDGHMARAGFPRLFGEFGHIAVRGEGDDFDAVREFAGDLEGGATDGTGGA